MASSISNEDGIPRELKEKLATFDTHLSELEAGLSPLLATNRLDLSKQLDAIDEAKTDLVAAYAINSLFWMYLNVCGVNPKEHSVKQELTRIQSYMTRVKEIEDKKKAPKLNKAVTKRYIRSALWKAAQDKTEGNGSEPGTAAPAAAQSSHTSHTQPSKMADKDGRKRKRDHR
uniref:Nuclear nucleic acid-binding protein C1D n=1 Tax=Arion vulgaris TaxID=1028688 RepID=A0A0B6YAZ6_9EUPU